MSTVRTDLLRSVSFFGELGEDDLAELTAHVVERSFRPGELVFSQGDAGSEMFVVAEGHVNIHLPGDASRRISLKDVARGEYFGELALFDDKPRSASAQATDQTTLLALSRETLTSYLGRRPTAAMPILRTMAERLRETNALLTERATKNAVEEVEKNLSWGDRLADKVAELNGSWAFIIALISLTLLWTITNAADPRPFDPYPYVFFNLLLAILVAVQGPLIVMSQNRQTLKDRAKADADFQVNLKNEVNIETLVRELGEFRAEANGRLANLENEPGNRT